MDKKTIIDISRIRKEFGGTEGSLVIFEDTSLQIAEGEKVAIVGASGSGKSTLLSLLAGLDKPTSGEICVQGRMIHTLSPDELSEYRNKNVSIIFQSFELISPFNSFENITAPLDIRGDLSAKDSKDIANTLLLEVGLAERAHSFPATLSGGERQRVAIARALASNTDIILADEPTGSLDGKTGGIVLDLLLREVDKRGKTLIIITHDMNIAQRMDRIIELKDKHLREIPHERKSV